MLFWRNLFLACLAIYINFNLILVIGFSLVSNKIINSRYKNSIKAIACLIGIGCLVLTIPMDQMALGIRPINIVMIAIYVISAFFLSEV